MAWKDGVLDIKRAAVRGPVDITNTLDTLRAGADRMDQQYDEASDNLQAQVAGVGGGGTEAPQWEPTEFAINNKTGEIQLPNGTVVKGDAPTLLQLATLTSKDGRPLPKLQRVQKGFRPMSQARMRQIIDGIPTDSDFFGEAYAAGKSTLGLMASAIDSMFGNDDPGNSWSDAQQTHRSQQTIGQVKAGDGRWYSSFDSFLSGLGETAGNVGGSIAGAVPLALAGGAAGAATGAGAGAAPGTLLGAGAALSGGAAAYGEQATEFYDNALAAMQKMTPEVLRDESPMFRRILRENPEMQYDEAMREVAIRGARVAGTTAGMLGAVEAMVGGRLAGNFLARMGVNKALLGDVADTVAKKLGTGASAARVAGRTTAGGLAAGAEEMGESMLGQAAGAATTGIGSDNPMDYANLDEGIAASLGGGIFGALGGRGRSKAPDPVDIGDTDIGAALGANTDMNDPWKQSTQLTKEQDQIPAALRRLATVPHPGPIEGLSGPAEVPPEQRAQVAQQLEAVLDQRFSDSYGHWTDKIQQIATDPGGRQLLGQLMAIQRAEQADATGGQPGEAPAYERGYGVTAGELPPGEAPAQGMLPLGGVPRITPQEQAPQPPMEQDPGVDPAQDLLPLSNDSGVPMSEDDGSRMPLNLRERRIMQEMRQQNAADDSAANPQALGVDQSVDLEDQIYRQYDEVEQLKAALAQRPPRDPRKKFLRDAIAAAEAKLNELEAQWADAREAEGLRSPALYENQIDSPEPLSAPSERTPDGRPMGVTPAAVANPEPMSPGEAQSRAATQAQRRGEDALTADQVAAAAASTEQQVSPSTPEPAGDIAAQLRDLADPKSTRDTVFVAEGPDGKPGKLPKTPKGVTRAERVGVGVLFTTDAAKAKRFSDTTRKLTDRDLQQMLGYSQSKGDALRRGKGKAPVVVQAVTKKGDVAAEQLTAPQDVPQAKKSLKKLSPKAEPKVTTPEKAQERRSLKGREKGTKPKAKKSLKKPATDEEKTEAQIEAGNYKKRHERFDGMEFAVETEAGQKRRPEWPALKHAYGYIKRTLGKDGDHLDAFFGPNEFSQDLPVFVVDQFVNGKFDEHKVMLGFKTADEAATAYKANYAKGWDGMRAITQMSWADFKVWAKDQEATQQRAERSANKTETRAERALQDKTEAKPAAPADTIEKAGLRTAVQIKAGGKPMTLPTKMTTRTGSKGATVDMRVEAVDEKALHDLGAALSNDRMNATDRAAAEKAMRDFDQLGTLLDAAVTAAEERLSKVLEGAPDGKTLMEAHKAEGTKTSPIAAIPLVISEIRGFLKVVRAEAKAEVGSYQPANSVARQLVTTLLPKAHAAMQHELDGKRILQQIAALTDADIESLLRNTHAGLADSTVAKQVMRGATEVAHAIRRADVDAVGSRTVPDFADHAIPGVERKVLTHATEHGTIPAEAQGLVNEWVRQFEKGGNKFSAPVHVMSIDDARKIFPGVFAAGVPNGKFLRRVDENGKVTDYVLAVDWQNLEQSGVAVEVLAHEFGHMVTTEMYTRLSPSARREIDNAYSRWLTTTRGRSVDDILRQHMPGAERMMFKAAPGDVAYAKSFWEWAARNAALYVLDPKRPHLNAVEKFFKSIADVLRSIYAKMTGAPQPDHAWAEALDRWIAGTATVVPMTTSEELSLNHEATADNPSEGDKLRRKNLGEQVKQGLEDVISILPGRVTSENVTSTMEKVTKGKIGELTKQIGLSLLTLRQIERMYRDTPLGPSLTGWVRNQQQKAQTANRALEAGSQWIERANQLDAKVRSALERIMYEATHFGIHPDKALTDPANAHLLRGSKHVQGVHARRYHGLVAKWNAMLAADANAAEVYAGLRDAFTDLHKKTLDRQIELIRDSNFTPKVKEDIIARLKQSKQMHTEGPYFPLMRFGNWIVSVQLPAFYVGKGGKEGGAAFTTKAEAREELRNQRALNPGARVAVEQLQGEDGKYIVRVFQKGVYFFDSEAAANAARGEIEAEVRENYESAEVSYDDALAAKEPLEGEAGAEHMIISPPKGARDGYNDLRAVSPELLNEMRSLLKEGKMDPEVANTIERLAIESMPENSYRKSLLPRQNVFGASKQMLRAYANRFQGAAHHYSVVEHGGAINRNWSRAWEAAATYPPGAEVLNTLAANQKAIADRTKDSKTNTVLNFATNASSMFSLAFSPAYVLTNALQPTMVTMPVLAGLTDAKGQQVGMVKAGKYLKAAYGEAPQFFTKRGFQDFINETKSLVGKRGDERTLQDGAKDIVTRFGKTAEERAMLESLLERGTLDFSWLNALEDAMRAGNKLSQKWAALQRVGMALPQQVEAMNRVTTALAAYRLAKDEKMLTDETSLQQFADDMVADTQLDYSRLNRPLAFNIPGLNVILQFKLYMQGMYMLFARHAAMAFGGPLPGETAEQRSARRKQGLKTIGYLLSTHAAGAGALGLGPVTYLAKLALVAFAASVGDDDDEWKSGEQLLKEMTTDLFGEYGSQVVRYGLPAAMGIDMSDRIGLPVLYDQRFANVKESDSAATGMDKFFLYSMGAPYSNARRVWQGGNDAWDGDWGKAMNGLPSGIRAVARSVKWGMEGIVDGDGDTFIPRDELSWRDLAINSLALQPLKTSVAYSERNEEKQTMARIMEARKRLLQGARTGEDVADEIREFNAKTPKKLRITADQIKQSKEAKRDRESGKLRSNEAAVRDYLK